MDFKGYLLLICTVLIGGCLGKKEPASCNHIKYRLISIEDNFSQNPIMPDTLISYFFDVFFDSANWILIPPFDSNTIIYYDQLKGNVYNVNENTDSITLIPEQNSFQGFTCIENRIKVNKDAQKQSKVIPIFCSSDGDTIYGEITLSDEYTLSFETSTLLRLLRIKNYETDKLLLKCCFRDYKTENSDTIALNVTQIEAITITNETRANYFAVCKKYLAR
jgi:hypothetical protein